MVASKERLTDTRTDGYTVETLDTSLCLYYPEDLSGERECVALLRRTWEKYKCLNVNMTCEREMVSYKQHETLCHGFESH